MYRIKLNNFEGPLDLLLFFIKRDELDIYDIPIAKITKEFLGYTQIMQMLDLEVAGEFIVMASTLMHIKVRMLLSKPGEEEEEEDPRAELVRRLLEYKRYKELAFSFSQMEVEQSNYFYREYFKDDAKELAAEEDGALKDVSVFHLIAAFKHAIEHTPKKTYHDIERINVTIEEQIEFILRFFGRRKRYTFVELIQNMGEKIRIVVTFIALLELMKNHAVSVKQTDVYHDIWIYRR